MRALLGCAGVSVCFSHILVVVARGGPTHRHHLHRPPPWQSLSEHTQELDGVMRPPPSPSSRWLISSGASFRIYEHPAIYRGSFSQPTAWVVFAKHFARKLAEFTNGPGRWWPSTNLAKNSKKVAYEFHWSPFNALLMKREEILLRKEYLYTLEGDRLIFCDRDKVLGVESISKIQQSI